MNLIDKCIKGKRKLGANSCVGYVLGMYRGTKSLFNGDVVGCDYFLCTAPITGVIRHIRCDLVEGIEDTHLAYPEFKEELDKKMKKMSEGEKTLMKQRRDREDTTFG